MEAKQLYWEIERIANIDGNSRYFTGEAAFYKFEPGTTDVPYEIAINYDERRDVGAIGLKIANKKFLVNLLENLRDNFICINQGDEKSNEWFKCEIELNKFSQSHIIFANFLDELLKNNRYNIPELIKAKFEKEGNNEYSLSLDNGQIWIYGHVCHGAEYGIQIAGYDLGSFESPTDLLNYANGLVKVEDRLKKSGFNFTSKNDSGHIDFHVETKAESEKRIRNDLERIIEIVSR